MERETTIEELENRIARLKERDSDGKGGVKAGSMAAFMIPKLEKKLEALRSGGDATMPDTDIDPQVHN